MRRLAIVPAVWLLLFAGGAGTSASDVAATDLANLRDIGGHARGALSVSPDGRWIVFQLQTPQVSAGDYELTWMALSTQSQKASRIADGGNVLLNPELSQYINGNRPRTYAKWSPDSSSFAYLLRENGQTQIWQSRPDREGRIQLTNNGGDVTDFVWSRDGAKLYFQAGLDKADTARKMREEGARGFLYDDRFHPRISTRPVFRDCGGPLHRRNLVRLERACEPTVWIYDLTMQEERLATRDEVETFNRLDDGLVVPEALKGRSYTHLRRWAEENRFAWLEKTDSSTDPDFYEPRTIFASIDNEIHQCTEKACQEHQPYIRELWWHRAGHEVGFLRREGPAYSRLGLYAWSPLTGALRKILQTDGRLSDCAPAGDRLICLYETWTQPRRIASVSLENGRIETIFDPNPEFARFRFPKVEQLAWQDAFGNSTFGHLVYPSDYDPGRDYPLVVVTYRSRGFLRGGTGDEFPIYPLAAEGFFVLSHDMPTKYGKDGSALERRKTTLSAQERIIEQLAGDGLIDKTRVAIAGLSDGAAQVSFALTHSNIDFAAAIATYVGSFSSSLYYMDNVYWRALWRSALFNELPPDNPDSGLNDISIGLNADGITTPFLINTSDSELRASVENVVRLEEAKKPVEMYVFPGEHHIKWRPEHRLAAYRRNIQWMKFWLLGETEPNPVSPGQYARWTALCRLHIENLRQSHAEPPCASNETDIPSPL